MTATNPTALADFPTFPIDHYYPARELSDDQFQKMGVIEATSLVIRVTALALDKLDVKCVQVDFEYILTDYFEGVFKERASQSFKIKISHLSPGVKEELSAADSGKQKERSKIFLRAIWKCAANLLPVNQSVESQISPSQNFFKKVVNSIKDMEGESEAFRTWLPHDRSRNMRKGIEALKALNIIKARCIQLWFENKKERMEGFGKWRQRNFQSQCFSISYSANHKCLIAQPLPSSNNNPALPLPSASSAASVLAEPCIPPPHVPVQANSQGQNWVNTANMLQVPLAMVDFYNLIWLAATPVPQNVKAEIARLFGLPPPPYIHVPESMLPVFAAMAIASASASGSGSQTPTGFMPPLLLGATASAAVATASGSGSQTPTGFMPPLLLGATASAAVATASGSGSPPRSPNSITNELSLGISTSPKKRVRTSATSVSANPSTATAMPPSPNATAQWVDGFTEPSRKRAKKSRSADTTNASASASASGSSSNKPIPLASSGASEGEAQDAAWPLEAVDIESSSVIESSTAARLSPPRAKAEAGLLSQLEPLFPELEVFNPPLANRSAAPSHILPEPEPLFPDLSDKSL
jgi:hypothetical protein